MHQVRVRFAPSPTGHLHIGGLRAAIFNWLFARHNKGVFLLRIEDTDQERSKPEYTQALLQGLSWAGITPDEPVVIQSSRFDQHRGVVEQLLKEGKVYRCYCKAEDISERAVNEDQDHLFAKYDGTCRKRKAPIAGMPYAIRFKVPENCGLITFNDLIRGSISIDASQLDDFIIVRSDGTPMYNFVVVVDDAFMKISHVIRGEEHISNTPKQILLYQACNYTLPQFAHLPLILGADGSKLSKRDAATAVIDYKKMGYLPDALFNYLVRLGWAHGDQEVFSKDEMINYFSLDAVSKKGAIFDQVKLDWLNSVYLKDMPENQLLAIIESDVKPTFKKEAAPLTTEQLLALITLYKSRCKTLSEMAVAIIGVAKQSQEYDVHDIDTWITPQTPGLLAHVIEECKTLKSFDAHQLANTLKEWCKLQKIKITLIAQPLRIALIGSSNGPGVFDLIAILGKQETIKRIEKFISYMQAHANAQEKK